MPTHTFAITLRVFCFCCCCCSAVNTKKPNYKKKQNRFVRKKILKFPDFSIHSSRPLIILGSFYFKDLFMHYNVEKQATQSSRVFWYKYIYIYILYMFARLPIMYAVCRWKFYLANNFTAFWPFVNVGFCNLPQHPSYQVSG